MRIPGEGSIEFGKDAAEASHGGNDHERSGKRERRGTGQRLHANLEQDDAVRQMGQQDERQEQGGVLHLRRERQADAAVGIPPGDDAVQPVVGG